MVVIDGVFFYENWLLRCYDATMLPHDFFYEKIEILFQLLFVSHD